MLRKPVGHALGSHKLRLALRPQPLGDLVELVRLDPLVEVDVARRVRAVRPELDRQAADHDGAEAEALHLLVDERDYGELALGRMLECKRGGEPLVQRELNFARGRRRRLQATGIVARFADDADDLRSGYSARAGLRPGDHLVQARLRGPLRALVEEIVHDGHPGSGGAGLDC